MQFTFVLRGAFYALMKENVSAYFSHPCVFSCLGQLFSEGNTLEERDALATFLMFRAVTNEGEESILLILRIPMSSFSLSINILVF